MTARKTCSHGSVYRAAGGGFDPLGLAAAEPEPAVGIEVAAVAHAMPDGGGTRVQSPSGFSPRGGGLGQGVVGLGDDGPGDDDFADFAGGKFAGFGERGDRAVVRGR